MVNMIHQVYPKQIFRAVKDSNSPALILLDGSKESKPAYSAVPSTNPINTSHNWSKLYGLLTSPAMSPGVIFDETIVSPKPLEAMIGSFEFIFFSSRINW